MKMEENLVIWVIARRLSNTDKVSCDGVLMESGKFVLKKRVGLEFFVPPSGAYLFDNPDLADEYVKSHSLEGFELSSLVACPEFAW